MTKKNYVAIAEILAHHAKHYEDIKEFKFLVDVCDQLADYFEQDNPRFDRERFLSACGVEKIGQCAVCDAQLGNDKKCPYNC